MFDCLRLWLLLLMAVVMMVVAAIDYLTVEVVLLGKFRNLCNYLSMICIGDLWRDYDRRVWGSLRNWHLNFDFIAGTVSTSKENCRGF